MRCPRILASTALGLALTLGVAPAALAQNRARTAPAPQREPVTEYGEGAFEPSQVEGTRHSGDGSVVRARRLQALGTLVRVRPDFYDQLKKSVENL